MIILVYIHSTFWYRFESPLLVCRIRMAMVMIPHTVGTKEGVIISIQVDKRSTAKKKKNIDDAVKDMWIE